MLFNSLEFIVFLPLVLAIYYCLNRHLIAQNVFLLISSYIFYAFWDWRFLSLVVLSSTVDYLCGRGMEKSEKKKRKIYLITSLVFNLGILSVFKYLDFFLAECVVVLGYFGFEPNVHSLNIILPLGISFYTFQTMAYTIDVYRGKISPEHNFLNFALYVSFFPQLVAGPIERAQHLLPQIKNKRTLTIDRVVQGGWLIYFGYFLKVFLADNLAQLVDPAFSMDKPGFYDTSTAIVAFAFQIYGDFAGYTFIAIGVAKCLGFDLMTNFLFPYFVQSPQAFWKNWHISLSTWLRDYLYIPLGGNRKGKILTYRNLMITMLLGGLWHGAAWNFIIWGGYHGLILILYRAFGWDNESSNRLIASIKLIIMLFLTCFGWLLFRVDNAEQFNIMALSLLDYSEATIEQLDNLKLLLFFIALPLTINLIQFFTNSGNMMDKIPIWSRVLIYIMMFYSIFAFGDFGKQEFIYFQF